MSDFILKYADTRGEVHSQTAQGASAQEIRERYTQQGFLVYSVKPKGTGISLAGEVASGAATRTLAQYGLATLIKESGDYWIASGTGIS